MKPTLTIVLIEWCSHSAGRQALQRWFGQSAELIQRVYIDLARQLPMRFL
jgi:hypothetical protein